MIPRCIGLVMLLAAACAQAGELRAGVFEADVTPPVGTPLCGSSVPPMQRVNDPIGARGIVLLPEGQPPIVLCAVDWTGIANGSHDAWRQALAEAAGTTRDRAAVHALHQHDAPMADATTEALLTAQGLGGLIFDPRFADTALQRTADAVRAAAASARPVTHLGMGEGIVEGVASNRRILGPDGTVRAVRWTACTDPELRAEPDGTIDPKVKLLSLWDGDTPIVVLTYYATHPQSFYRTGAVSADFVGMARSLRVEATGIPHVHFNGASGNIGAGKYNDGSPENRPVLAGRLAEGMRLAWEATKKRPIAVEDVDWVQHAVTLPRRAEVDADHERAVLADAARSQGERIRAAFELAWIERAAEHPTELSCLTLGPARLLHLPGELFVEYQLGAQAMLPESFVCTAAYGDYGPGYIGTEIAYPQGGYETGVYTSRTAPEVEAVLTAAIRMLLTGT